MRNKGVCKIQGETEPGSWEEGGTGKVRIKKNKIHSVLSWVCWVTAMTLGHCLSHTVGPESVLGDSGNVFTNPRWWCFGGYWHRHLNSPPSCHLWQVIGCEPWLYSVVVDLLMDIGTEDQQWSFYSCTLLNTTPRCIFLGNFNFTADLLWRPNVVPLGLDPGIYVHKHVDRM